MYMYTVYECVLYSVFCTNVFYCSRCASLRNLHVHVYTANTQVFCTELGLGTLHIWKTILTVSGLLSPPIFTQISVSGIRPLCHVNRCVLYGQGAGVLTQETRVVGISIYLHVHVPLVLIRQPPHTPFTCQLHSLFIQPPLT